MAELLRPRLRELRHEYQAGFLGMTLEPVTLEELEAVRLAMIAQLVGEMPGTHRDFLLSFKRGHPNWERLNLPQVAQLPAVQWKVANLAKLKPSKRAQLVDTLAAILER